ncbi:MAG: hypothetical protein B6I31_04135 [Desulfobacteraceae bacterium 4572_19]|nr:MAG: hypothetical protein B6I31_04135 [Desulfobacteraceae bacterium 4572_19]
MQNGHALEKQQFLKLFKQEGIDRLDDRVAILEIFLKTEQHITMPDFVKLVKQSHISIQPDFINDTIKLLCKFGFAQKVHFEGGPVRYEHRHIGRHHDHMICTKCRKIVEFESNQIENIQSHIAASHGFHMLQHKMELYGICSKCFGERPVTVPLTVVKSGETLKIKEFLGGSKMQSRLTSMGLKKEDKVEVISSYGKGQVVVAVDNKRFSLGRGLADKIMVQNLGVVQK